MHSDPSLSEALKPKHNLPVESDRFEHALQKTIKEYVDDRMKQEDPNTNKLIPIGVLRNKLENEVREALNLNELNEHIKNAVHILRDESAQYLSSEETDSLQKSLESLRIQFENLDLNNLDNETLKNALNISTEDRTSILKIGIAKFTEKHLADSLSIFTFLTSLDSENADYWYRLGLVAQESENYDLALQVYTSVLQLAPEFLGARIFRAQCYLSNKQRDNALAELAEIKNILKTKGKDEKWSQYVDDIDNLLTNAN